MQLTVNGNPITIDPLPGEMLSDLLRERLGLTGTKIGCNEAECGTCTVLVDGEPVLSCVYPAGRAAGKQVITVEGLAALAPAASAEPGAPALHPLQEAFIAHGAVQCGFCIPGQLMTSAALLNRNPDPDRADIRHALKDTLCRCAGYPTIEHSILDAAQALRTGSPIHGPEISLTGSALHAIGVLRPRPDSVAKVTGQAVFSDDISFEGMLHARVKRAGVPHAILTRLEVEQASRLPGVVAVLTAADIPGSHFHGLVIPDWPVLVGVGERVRYVGDAVAIVAAETRQIASAALELIEVDYDLQR